MDYYKMFYQMVGKLDLVPINEEFGLNEFDL